MNNETKEKEELLEKLEGRVAQALDTLKIFEEQRAAFLQRIEKVEKYELGIMAAVADHELVVAKEKLVEERAVVTRLRHELTSCEDKILAMYKRQGKFEAETTILRQQTLVLGRQISDKDD